MSSQDRSLLLKFLEKLRGGSSKVVITSRSEENWLDIQRLKVSIGGLLGEERWEFCETVLGNLGLPVERDDKDLVELMELLNGHPLAMRVVLPRLEKLSARQVIDAIRGNMQALGAGADSLYGTLRFAVDNVARELKVLLIPLALHEQYVDADLLEPMVKQVDEGLTRDKIDAFLSALVPAGLLRDTGQNVHELHPALTGFLRTTVLESEPPESRDRWARAFVDVMGSVADELTPLELHQQRPYFYWHTANFHYALAEAERLKMTAHQGAIIQSLAAWSQNTRDFAEAERLFVRLKELWRESGDEEGVASTYHQLGMIAEEQRDFKSAEKWYLKSLEIKERQGNEHGAAITYHQLGMIAEEQRDFKSAEKWYLKSLEIEERLDDEHAAAITYHQLGRIAEEQLDFKSAERWYLKSLEIEERQGNEHGAAQTYHQLGRIAEEQRDFKSAEKWYLKSLEIEERLGDEHAAALTYGQLGILAGLQGQFEESGRWLIKAAVIFARVDAPHELGAAAGNFAISCRQAQPEVQQKLEAMWKEAGLGELPEVDDFGAG
jgi:tetratricopeptide (TPR) repeat protein